MEQTRLLYFAAPLFTQGEWLWNRQLADELKKEMEVLLPQDTARAMLYRRKKFDAHYLFDANVNNIGRANIVLAVLDQPDPDSGTSWECGYAYSLGIPIVGLRTDIRRAGDDPKLPTNLMLSRSCREVLQVPDNKRDDVRWVGQRLIKLIRRIAD